MFKTATPSPDKPRRPRLLSSATRRPKPPSRKPPRPPPGRLPPPTPQGNRVSSKASNGCLDNSPVRKKYPFILDLPLELQHILLDVDYEVYKVWPLLCKQTATTSRFNDSFEKNGMFLAAYSYSKPYRQASFKNGIHHGLCKSWHDNGQLAIQFSYTNGKFEGEYKQWYETGQLEVLGTSKYGKWQGEFQEWLNTGVLKKHCQYKSGDIERWFVKGGYKFPMK
mmetsp:Transcript_5339/g.5821  ORF Transcript_5339/g.5821 Transcript_5339/m.5821 type:complete len:223 (+) Transcript_5339:125-793(+)